MNTKDTPATKRSFLRSNSLERSDTLTPCNLCSYKNHIPKNNRFKKSEKGIGKFTLLVFGSITAVILFCGYHIIPFFYYYYEIQNHFDSHARVASVYTDKQIREKLWTLIKRMQIPVEPQDLRISRTASEISISMNYSEVFYISWQGKDYDLYTFNFNPKASQPIAKK